jgi:organic hydroperoxide reductase OsmC/OhrA
MKQPEKALYTAKVHTTGGRDGASRISDSRLEDKAAPLVTMAFAEARPDVQTTWRSPERGIR